MKKLKYSKKKAVFKKVNINRKIKIKTDKIKIMKQLLDKLDTWVYAIDFNSLDILFVNKKIVKTFGKNGFKKELPSKIIKHSITEDVSSYVHEYYDEQLKAWILSSKSLVKWSNDTTVLLGVDIDISKDKEKDLAINRLIWYNTLTNLPNKSFFIKDLSMLLETEDTCGAIIILDINDFKLINDGYGYEQGDNFLLCIADFLKSIIESDCKLYHFGGDQFVIISEGIDNYKNTIELIRNRFKYNWIVGDYEHYCTVNIGVALFPKNGDDTEILLRRVDTALNIAKGKGSNCVYYFRKNEDIKIYNRLRKVQMMREAVELGCTQFFPYYQPLVDAKTGEWIGAEALLRWEHPDDGMISPAEFIPLAEHIGLINVIGEHVLLDACETCKNWHNNGFPQMTVSVNLSVSQLYEKNFAEKIKDILIQTRLEPEHLTLEITEGIAMYDLKKTITYLEALRNIGLYIALDDFGKGYSSLSNLKLLPINHLKIDRSFICDLNKNDYHFVFIKTMIELAHTIELVAYCEGVEYQEQVRQLREFNADVLQGYYFSKPLPKDEFLKKLIIKSN